MAFRTKFGIALRDLHEQLGDKGTIKTFREMLSDGTLDPEDCSLREIRESISSDMFPNLTGELINSTIIREFEALDTIGNQLCTVTKSNKEIDNIAGFDAVEMPEEVQQGREYNESDWGEKYVTSQNKKFGRLLTITEEAVYFDQTSQILNRARGIGQKAALHKERQIVYGVQDITDYESYYPDGTQTALFSSANGNLVTSNPFGEEGLQDVLTSIHEQTDEQGDPIYIPKSAAICLHPIHIFVQVNQMADSAKVPEGVENAKNVFQGMFTPLTSPFVSDQSSTTWYYGDPLKAFLWTEVWPLQTFTQKKESDEMFKRDLAARYKVRYYGNLTCALPEYWYKATA